MGQTVPYPRVVTGDARYDGLADWYDEEIRGLDITGTALDALARLLGSGAGKCLDLGCGTGIAFPRLRQLGWTVVGIDISADQLRVARERNGDLPVVLVHADASSMPFADESYDAVVSLWTHTDFDDPEAVFAESRRVLRPGGKFVDVGAHPCFVTPFAEPSPTGTHVLHPGYRKRGWIASGPAFGHGIRPRVGVNHLPLPDLMNAIISSGLTLQHIDEPGEDDYPLILGVVATR